MKQKWGKWLLILLFPLTSQMMPVVASTTETTASISFIDPSPVPHTSQPPRKGLTVMPAEQPVKPSGQAQIPLTGEVTQTFLIILGIELLLIIGLWWQKGGDRDAKVT